MIHIQIQHAAGGLSSQTVKICRQLLIGSGIRNEISFFQCITGCRIMVSGNSILTLMISTVHITIYQKIHIAVIFHRKDPDIMMVVVAPHICAVIIAEGKNPHGTAVFRLKAPEIPVHPIRQGLPAGTLYQLYTVILRDAKQDTLSGILTAVTCKDLIYCPVILHHVNAKLIPFQGKIFLDLIRFLCAIPLPLCLIGKLYAAHHAI